MKPLLLCLTILCFLFLISCDNEEIKSEWVDVIVISEAVDCSENWILQYKIPETGDTFDKFQEIGLPSEYKTEGEQLKLKIRDPKKEENFPCTTLGISYPFKIILEAKRE